MAVIAWTVLGLASGLLARGLLPGRAKGFINAKDKSLAAGSPGLPAANPAPPPANGT
jgi:hypothetical protein